MESFMEDLKELKKISEPIESLPLDGDYDHNLLNMGDNSDEQRHNLDKIVYRVMKMDHFIKWCKEGKNVLPSVDKWDDPWERALFKSPVHYKNNEYIDVNNFRYYGQCWSFEENESDATWRIFKANEGGCVRVGIKAGDLFDSLKSFVGSLASVSCYAGSVIYRNESEIQEFFEKIPFADRLTSSGIDLASTLFIKRKEFEHEKEFRVLYFPTDGVSIHMPKPEDGLFKYDLAVDKIKYVEIGPEISHCIHELKEIEFRHNQIKQVLMSYGVTCNIERSTIYDFPLLNVEF